MAAAADMWLRERDKYTARLLESPYDASIYLERARCHEELQYPDLAAGDAYRSLILTDEVLDEAGEYHEQAIEAVEQVLKKSIDENGQRDNSERLQQSTAELQDAVQAQSRSAYEILGRTLIICGDLKSAWDFTQRGCQAFPTDGSLQAMRAQLASVSIHGQPQLGSARDTKAVTVDEGLSKEGHSRREIYPWNAQEPERYTPSALSFLNHELSEIAPKCEVRIVELPLLTLDDTMTRPASHCSQKIPLATHKQLGLFATSDLLPHEIILHEPSILTANNRLHDTLCDACSSPLPASPSPLPASPSPLPTCPSCDDTVFCSPSCLARAQKSYHPAVCGHPDFDASARDPSPAAATDALYLLLLARTIAMAETQNLHPLALREIKYLWGDFSSSTSSASSRLPFSFQTNIQTPLNLLSNLHINIFSPESFQRYDFWVINTLLAKYRGVASAKMNPRTGMPEVCAVHWRWCLANHSCAPNVKWEWPAAENNETLKGKEREEEGGCMALIVRGGDEVVQWGSQRREGGIKKDHEILSHYCDVDLPVEARREWAVGALGGVCVCERCVWEAGKEEKGGGGLGE